MTRLCWWLVETVSRVLEPDERNAVRGDFAESGETGGGGAALPARVGNLRTGTGARAHCYALEPLGSSSGLPGARAVC